MTATATNCPICHTALEDSEDHCCTDSRTELQWSTPQSDNRLAPVRSWPGPPPKGQQPPWWVPLLIPGVLIVLVVISSIGDNGGNSGSRGGMGDLLLGFAMIVATFVLPAFWSGVLYVRQHERNTPRPSREPAAAPMSTLSSSLTAEALTEFAPRDQMPNDRLGERQDRRDR